MTKKILIVLCLTVLSTTTWANKIYRVQLNTCLEKVSVSQLAQQLKQAPMRTDLRKCLIDTLKAATKVKGCLFIQKKIRKQVDTTSRKNKRKKWGFAGSKKAYVEPVRFFPLLERKLNTISGSLEIEIPME